MLPSRQSKGQGSVRLQLMESPEWQALSEPEIQLVERSVIIRLYNKGDAIFNEGDACGGLYLLADGLVCIRKASSKGPSTLVKVARSGDTLGYQPLLAEQNHRASAEALVATRICFIEEDLVTLLMRNNRTLAINFLKKAAVELGRAEERFHQSVSLSFKERLIRQLIALQAEFGHIGANGRPTVDLPVSRADLAAMLGVRRESLSRSIHDLSSEGVVRIMGRHIEIPNTNQRADRIQALESIRTSGPGNIPCHSRRLPAYGRQSICR
mgnify:CR=1 FL=1